MNINRLFIFVVNIVPLFTTVLVYGQENSSNNGSLEGYVLPRTVFTVEIEQQKETVKKGPYARFAQKYLGIAAPLSDKEQYSIKNASISSFREEPDISVIYGGNAGNRLYAPTKEDTVTKKNYDITVKSHTYDVTGYVDVAPDRYTTSDYSLEDMAAMAADRIFIIRKRRFDLVTGEAGENVFGAGLKDAIKEMERMEEELLSLFLGKTIIENEIVKYNVIPARNAPATIICRFSETKGLLPDSDLSGRPVTLEISRTEEVPDRTGKDSKETRIIRIPAYAKCTVKEGNQIYTEISGVPVYQFGKDMELPAITKR